MSMKNLTTEKIVNLLRDFRISTLFSTLNNSNIFHFFAGHFSVIFCKFWIIAKTLLKAHSKNGLKVELRITPCNYALIIGAPWRKLWLPGVH